MGQGILGNMRVCPGLSLPEPGACLQLAGAGATEWQAPVSKMYASGRSGGIKTGDVGSLEIWLGRGDSGFGEDGRCWVGKEMGQSDWESSVTDHL